MRKRRILPATWPSTRWPLSSLTRNIAFGSASTTSPSNSTLSSLAMARRTLPAPARRSAGSAGCRAARVGRPLRRRLIGVGRELLLLLGLLGAGTAAAAGAPALAGPAVVDRPGAALRRVRGRGGGPGRARLRNGRGAGSRGRLHGRVLVGPP